MNHYVFRYPIPCFPDIMLQTRRRRNENSLGFTINVKVSLVGNGQACDWMENWIPIWNCIQAWDNMWLSFYILESLWIHLETGSCVYRLIFMWCFFTFYLLYNIRAECWVKFYVPISSIFLTSFLKSSSGLHFGPEMATKNQSIKAKMSALENETGFHHLQNDVHSLGSIKMIAAITPDLQIIQQRTRIELHEETSSESI